MKVIEINIVISLPKFVKLCKNLWKCTFSFKASLVFLKYIWCSMGCLDCKWENMPEVEPSGRRMRALHAGLILHMTTALSSVSSNSSQSRIFLLVIPLLLDLFFTLWVFWPSNFLFPPVVGVLGAGTEVGVGSSSSEDDESCGVKFWDISAYYEFNFRSSWNCVHSRKFQAQYCHSTHTFADSTWAKIKIKI